MKRVAVLTSGGDSAGMNAAVRSVVKMALHRGCEAWIVREGWEGLVRGNDTVESKAQQPDLQERISSLHSVVPGLVPTLGTHLSAHLSTDSLSRTSDAGSAVSHKSHLRTGDGQLLRQGAGDGDGDGSLKGQYLVRVGWDDVRGWLDMGGTLIGTARCAAFRSREGRRAAALTLVSHGIDALVVAGGDGSLTGADLLRSEWSSLLDELLASASITSDQRYKYSHLKITGIVASIDNDYAGTDLTIGAATALHRICEAIDCISATAASHSRAFVIEVMGRHCGWLAVMAGMACAADFILIPEQPPAQDWQDQMCAKLQRHRSLGKRKTIVIVAEGAIDRNLEPISSKLVAQLLTDRLHLDTRVTTLGHTQRGGKPCAWDRVLASLQGVEAVHTLLDSLDTDPSFVIGIKENKITRIPLAETVQLTKDVATAIQAKDFDKALSLRDADFQEGLQAFFYGSSATLPECQTNKRLGIIHVGAPAGGINAATRTAVRYAIYRGWVPLGILSGFQGLVQGSVSTLSWLQVDSWVVRGGSELGINRMTPQEAGLQRVAEAFASHKIDALLIVGGFEAFTALQQLNDARSQFPRFDIPMVHLPATISNNVPLTEFTLGSDTSLNALVDACDVIKQSASASRSRVFVVETQGGNSGYLATLGALAVGAVLIYTPEERVGLADVARDVEFLKRRYELDIAGQSEGRIVIRNENASNVYTTQVLTDIFAEEGGALFDSRSAILGHTLQGGVPSPLDRVRGVKMAKRCVDFLLSGNLTASTITIQSSEVVFASIDESMAAADTKRRLPKDTWWQRNGIRAMAEMMGGKTDIMDESGRNNWSSR